MLRTILEILGIVLFIIYNWYLYKDIKFLKRKPTPKQISGETIDRISKIFSELEEINRDISLNRINYARNWEMFSDKNLTLEKAYPNLFKKRNELHGEFREIINKLNENG